MDEESNSYFTGLIFSLSTLVLQQLGKIANPLSSKIERNLEQAKTTIDMLLMLKEKTKGNLTEKEEKILNNILADLQLNYVDEVKKGTAENAEKKSTDSAETKKENTGSIP
ncbi:MAG TPA: DUF1844 domain-containing protein [Elusimicrobia bacterium]|jgi:polyhydroxyalkanoate synthesis regulator phasin|nr:DUF1844 domain-containing protein [Elusimicrobiota bacterium]